MIAHETPRLRPARAVLAFALLAACLWFIWSNSMQSAADSARRSAQVAAILKQVLTPMFGAGSWVVAFSQAYVRKIVHAAEFAMLGVTMVAMLGILGWVRAHNVAHAAFGVLLVAVADETIQAFTGRGSSVLDVVLDFAGGLAGILLALCVYWIFRGLFRKSKNRRV